MSTRPLAVLKELSLDLSAGELIDDNKYYELTATDLNDQVWCAKRILPSIRGHATVGGVVHGHIDFLENTSAEKLSTSGFLRIRFRGLLKFPCNTTTQTLVDINGRQKVSIDFAGFQILSIQ